MSMIQTIAKLEQSLEVMKRIHGDKWQDESKPYREILSDLMRKTGSHNALSEAIPVAKQMVMAGESPLMLLAVATEMSMSNNQGESHE